MRHMSPERQHDCEDWDKLVRTIVDCPHCKHSIPIYFSRERDEFLTLGLFCRACDTPYGDMITYQRLN